MCPNHPHLPGIVLLLVGLIGFTNPLSVRSEDQREDQLPNAEAVLSNLLQWPERLTTLRIVWEETFHDADSELLKKHGFYGFDRSVTEWTWCKDGRGRLRIDTYANGAGVAHIARARDGEFGYSASFASADDPLTEPLTLGVALSKFEAADSLYDVSGREVGESFVNTPLDGIWSSRKNLWVSTLLQTEKLETGYETVGDRVLPFVNIPSESLVLVLDPEAGGLPRITWREDPYSRWTDPELGIQADPDYALENRVERFEEIEPGFWFPMAGTYRQKWYDRKDWQDAPELNEFRRWTVKEVHINESFADSDFQIHPRIGTLVKDPYTNQSFLYGPGMPPFTMENGLNRKIMDWMASGARGPHPFVREEKKTISPRERWKPILLLIALLLGLGIFAWSVYWGRSEETAQ